jgi:hypothetical protein
MGIFACLAALAGAAYAAYSYFFPPAPQFVPAQANFEPNQANFAPAVTQGQLVNSTSQIQCMWGSAPMPLTVVPTGTAVSAMNMLAANVSAMVPMANIPTFGQCMSMTNPANATFATTGVYAPCVPAVAAPWTPGCTALKINGLPAVNSTNTCMCTLGQGTIRVVTSMAPIVQVG